MAKPETNFIARVHRRLTEGVYKQAMGLTSTNGTPDYYYEGPHGCMWIEYKWYPEKPTIIDLTNPKKKPHLSALQRLWLNRAMFNRINAFVVAGYPGGGCFLLKDGVWNGIICVLNQYDRPVEDIVSMINELKRGRSSRRKAKPPK